MPAPQPPRLPSPHATRRQAQVAHDDDEFADLLEEPLEAPGAPRLTQGRGASAEDDFDATPYLNLADVRDEIPFQLIPKGTYDGIIEGVEYTRSQRNTPMLVWTLRLSGGSLPPSGRTLRYHTTLTDEFGLARLKRLVVRVAPDLDLHRFDYRNANALMANRRCRAVVTIRANRDGEMRNQVQDILEPAEAF